MRKTLSLFIVLIVAGCASSNANRVAAVDKVALAESRYKMGVAYLNTDNDYKAYLELKSALEMEPENDKYLYTMGLFFIKKERYEEAEPFIRRALDKKPDESEYLNAYATVLAGTGRLEEALGFWDRVIADPGYPYQIIALYNAGNALYEAGNYAKVPYYVERALSINRRYAKGYELLFNSYMRLGDRLKAEQTALEAARMISENPFFQLQVAEFYFDKKEYAKAIPFLEILLDNFPTTTEGARAEELMKQLGLLQ